MAAATTCLFQCYFSYNASLRWFRDIRYVTAAETVCRRVREVHALMARHTVRVTCRDYRAVFREPGDCHYYLDPPYVAQSHHYYGGGRFDHAACAAAVRSLAAPWVLSNDTSDAALALYGPPAVVHRRRSPNNRRRVYGEWLWAGGGG